MEDVAAAVLTPEEIVNLLLRATPGPEFDDLLHRIRHRFVRVAQHKFPGLGDEIDDIVQHAMVQICNPATLRSIEERGQFWPFAYRILVRRGLDAWALARARSTRMALAPGGSENDDQSDLENWLHQFPDTSDSDPAAIAERRDMLRRAIEEIKKCPVGQARLLEGLSEEEVCRRTGLTRDQVAGRLKRLRAKLRRLQ